FRARRQLQVVADRTGQIRSGDLLLVSVLRNEVGRLPYFLKYYRDLGVAHFLVVDNASDDGSAEYLSEQGDISLWRTSRSYRESRFGLDWLTWLQMRFCHGHWVLLVDADELLVYPGQDRHDLRDLTGWLDDNEYPGFGALMLELYPKGPVDRYGYEPGQDPLEVLQWFDPAPYRAMRQRPMGNLWVQGGVRERMFFADQPQKSPTLNKIPLIKWDRRFAYVNSTHSALPPRLNAVYSGPGGVEPSGVLIHTKFLPEIVSKSAIEKERGQHFAKPNEFAAYYDSLTRAPDFWTEGSMRYEGPEQLASLGLLRGPDWAD
ncbi:MAG: glycosyltransferase family 2 protein, partial [Thalassovita sp.]|nr:glycosyltransferase family 2 protein [Thalassovita sp.]